MCCPWVGLEYFCSVVKIFSTWSKNGWEQSQTKLGNKLWWLCVCPSVVLFRLLPYWGPYGTTFRDQKSFPQVQFYLSCISVLDLAWQQEASNKLILPELSIVDTGPGVSCLSTSQPSMPVWLKWVSDRGFQTLSQGQGKGRDFGLYSILCLFWKCINLLGKVLMSLWPMGEEGGSIWRQFWRSCSFFTHEKSLLRSFQ